MCGIMMCWIRSLVSAWKPFIRVSRAYPSTNTVKKCSELSAMLRNISRSPLPHFSGVRIRSMSSAEIPGNAFCNAFW